MLLISVQVLRGDPLFSRAHSSVALSEGHQYMAQRDSHIPRTHHVVGPPEAYKLDLPRTCRPFLHLLGKMACC